MGAQGTRVRRGPLSWAPLATALIAAVIVTALARSAAAQEVGDLPIPSPGPPPVTSDLDQIEKRAFWGAGRPRWFFAATLEAGNIYGRASAAVGYGRPHSSWLGIEGYSSISPSGVTEYAGLHASSSMLDFRFGARYTMSTNHHFLVPRPTYSRDQIEDAAGSRSRYVALEAEVASGFPLWRGSVFGVGSIYAITGEPRGWYVFEQSLQVVAQPPLLWRARLGYLVNVDKYDSFRVGAAVEAIGNPDRDAVVVRAGPGVSVMITHHLEAFGWALLVISSPDQLGLSGAQTGELGFRYRWATGDRWPEFP